MSSDETIERRVAQVVEERWPGVKLVDLNSLTGHSGMTLKAELTGGDAPQFAVVKLCPPGREPVGRHDVIRQASLLVDLAGIGDIPIPDVLAARTSETPVVILAWKSGEALEPILEMTSGTKSESALGVRYRKAAKVLARLHAVDPAALSAARDLVPLDPVGEVAKWSATMATVDPELRAGAEQLHDALCAQAPPMSSPKIVHGDYRLGNLLFLDTELTAVIDWEIWCVGDARMDLGWFRIMSEPADLPGIATEVAGVVAPSGVLDAYETAAGSPVGDMTWFDAAARYKMAAIMGNNLRRHRTGRRPDPYQERLLATIPYLIASGIRLVS